MLTRLVDGETKEGVEWFEVSSGFPALGEANLRKCRSTQPAFEWLVLAKTGR